MRKKLSALLLIFALMLCGCNNGGNMHDNHSIQGYVINNHRDLGDIIFTSYDIVELDAYFLYVNSLRYDYTKTEEETPHHYTIDDVNKQFPIECLRSNGNALYSVYKVEQGGYYYVFWSNATSIEDNTVSLIANFVTYISEQKEYEDFSEIVVGVSTANDVKSIDRYFEFVDFMSHSTLSYSLTPKGLVEIKYDINTDADSLDSYVVSSVNVVNRDSTVSCIAYILDKDIPI